MLLFSSTLTNNVVTTVVTENAPKCYLLAQPISVFFEKVTEWCFELKCILSKISLFCTSFLVAGRFSPPMTNRCGVSIINFSSENWKYLQCTVKKRNPSPLAVCVTSLFILTFVFARWTFPPFPSLLRPRFSFPIFEFISCLCISVQEGFVSGRCKEAKNEANRNRREANSFWED